ncbi:hypothetical protein HSBAA_22140 [Vreelandella sulfidaeris]|uniref:Uncharacterized protein n=1 Tax=Vreelandella sulfidaeris TaxID=115553 RepID=A0A455U9G6_9GAMM|nr:hypothetical protein HSBAA_22140 [Halomonas sulfidaeris]
MVIASGHVEIAIFRAETDSSTIMGASITEGVVGSFRLVGNVLDDIGAICNLIKIAVDRHAEHAIGARLRDVGRRVHIDRAIFVKIWIDRYTVHPRLSLADKIISSGGILIGAFHA